MRTDFNGLTGEDITSDTNNTSAVALGNMDGDGDLDVVAGNSHEANRLCLNNGTADPFNGVSGADITADTHVTRVIAPGEVNGDGDFNIVAGNYDERNRLYRSDFKYVSRSEVCLIFRKPFRID